MFITDIHGDVAANKALIAHAKELTPDLIMLGGDISNNTKASVRQIFNPFLRLGIPVAYYPGSHENSDVLEGTLKEIKNKWLINCIQPTNRLLKLGKYELVVLPGSYAVASGPKAYYGGNYWLFEKRDPARLRRNHERLREIKWAKQVRPIYMSDSSKDVFTHGNAKGPYRIGFCHDPPKFTKKTSIDVAHFGMSTAPAVIKKSHTRRKEFKAFGIKKETIWENNIMQLDLAKLLKSYGYPIKIMKKNVGNPPTSKFFKKHRVKKIFCGHIHEAGPRAIDSKEHKVKPKTPVKELYVNNGTGFAGKYTIIRLGANGSVTHEFKVAKSKDKHSKQRRSIKRKKK